MSKSVVQKIGVPPAQDGGGLAAVIRDLTTDTTAENAENRHVGLSDAPVSGESSLLHSTVGLVLNLVRIAYSFLLEYLDLGEVRNLGDSKSINLDAFLSPVSFPEFLRRIEERESAAERLLVDPNVQLILSDAVIEILEGRVALTDVYHFADAFGMDNDTWNGIAARRYFLERIYAGFVDQNGPSVQLDHDATAQLRLRILEFLSAVWKRFAHTLLIQQPLTDLIILDQDNAALLLQKSDSLGQAIEHAISEDGLVRSLGDSFEETGRLTINDSGDITQIFNQAVWGRGATWLRTENCLYRFSHLEIAAALLGDHPDCPEPDLIVAAESDIDHVMDMYLCGQRLLALISISGTPAFYSLDLEGLENWDHRSLMLPSDTFHVGGSDDFSDLVPWTTGYALVKGDPFSVPLVLGGGESGFWRLDSVSQIPISPPDIPLELDNLNVYTLSLSLDSEYGSHVLLVIDDPNTPGQRLLLGETGSHPWWDGGEVNWIAEAALHPALRVLGAVNDQLIINDQETYHWTFFPFRTLATGLWNSDEELFRGLLEAPIGRLRQDSASDDGMVSDPSNLRPLVLVKRLHGFVRELQSEQVLSTESGSPASTDTLLEDVRMSGAPLPPGFGFVMLITPPAGSPETHPKFTLEANPTVGSLVRMLNQLLGSEAAGASISLGEDGKFTIKDAQPGASSTMLRLFSEQGDLLLTFNAIQEGSDGILSVSTDLTAAPVAAGVNIAFKPGVVHDYSIGSGDPYITLSHSESGWGELYRCYDSTLPKHISSFSMGATRSGSMSRQNSHCRLRTTARTNVDLTVADAAGSLATVTTNLQDLAAASAAPLNVGDVFQINLSASDNTTRTGSFIFDEDHNMVGDLLDQINQIIGQRAMVFLSEARLYLLDLLSGPGDTSLRIISPTESEFLSWEEFSEERILVVRARSRRVEFKLLKPEE